MTSWQIGAVAPGAVERDDAELTKLPMKWAHDAASGKPLYIHDDPVVQGTCQCLCPACKQILIPVLAGQPLHTDPTAHFRHPPGTRKDTCTIVAARLAATEHLLENGFIDLPRRTMSRSALGFSGERYEVWVEIPEERRKIKAAGLIDRTTAELTLDDGRILLVDLTGQATTATSANAVMVTIALSDPILATLSIEEIRSRLRILPGIQWCAHWQDAELAAQGDAKAHHQAQELFDQWSPQDEAEFRALLPSETDENTARHLRQETILHREAKAILERKQKIKVPSVELTVWREPPEEFSDDWNPKRLRAFWCTVPIHFDLKEVRLERRLGRIVPDVIATFDKPGPTMRGMISTWIDDDFEEENEEPYSFSLSKDLLIEVTVTHGIDSTKLSRILELNLPTLEIDLSQFGGRIALADFEDLIINQTIGKRWVHHPMLPIKRARLVEFLDQHPVTVDFRRRLIELNRPYWLSHAAEHWAEYYLGAITAYHDANVAIRRVQRRRSTGGLEPQTLGPDSELWINLRNAADALGVHGFDGAMDSVLIHEKGIIARILSIQRNTGVGYDVSSGYQVVDAIMGSGKDNKTWDSLYAIAVKTYDLTRHFNDEQRERYKPWREALADNIKGGMDTHLRPSTYDRLLSLLFPQMAQGISGGFGRIESKTAKP